MTRSIPPLSPALGARHRPQAGVLYATALLLGIATVGCGGNGPADPSPVPSAVVVQTTPPAVLPAGSAVVARPAVRVTAADARPAAGVLVTFAVASGQGMVTGGTVRTDASGIAIVGGWTLANAVGTNVLTATVARLSPVTFTVEGVPGSPARVTSLATSALVGDPLDTLPALAVRVSDAHDNPVPGAEVAWSVSPTGARILDETTVADASGTTATMLILGPEEGTFSVVASVTGASPATISVKAERRAARVVVTPGDVSLDVGTERTFTTAAFDKRGAPLSGRPVVWRVARANVARIGADGELAADEVGVTDVIATVDTAQGTARVLVRPVLVDALTRPAGMEHVEVYDVNDARVVVGAAYLYNGYSPRPFVSTPGRGSVELPLIATNSYMVGQARGVNAAGTIVGYSYDNGSKSHLVTWTTAGALTDLGMLGYSLSQGRKITNAGTILFVRNAVAPSGIVRRAIVRAPDGTLTDIGSLDGGSCEPAGISAMGGVVVASCTQSGSASRAVRWSAAAGLRALPVESATALSVATLADGTEMIAGYRSLGYNPETFSHVYRAFAWTERDGHIDLGTLGGESSEAVDVNPKGQVVGISDMPDGTRHAFLWTRETGLLDLGVAAGSSWSAASAISPRGVIAGTVPVSDAPPPYYQHGPNQRPVLWVTQRDQ